MRILRPRLPSWCWIVGRWKGAQVRLVMVSYSSPISVKRQWCTDGAASSIGCWREWWSTGGSAQSLDSTRPRFMGPCLANQHVRSQTPQCGLAVACDADTWPSAGEPPSKTISGHSGAPFMQQAIAAEFKLGSRTGLSHSN